MYRNQSTERQLICKFIFRIFVSRKFFLSFRINHIPHKLNFQSTSWSEMWTCWRNGKKAEPNESQKKGDFK